MTAAGIEQMIFRFVAQHLNHCATAIPLVLLDMTQYSMICRRFRSTCCPQLNSCYHNDLGTCFLRTLGKMYTAQDGVISYKKGNFWHRPDVARHRNERIVFIFIFIENNFFSLIIRTFFYVISIFCGQGSSVGIVTDYGLDGPGSNAGGDENFRPYGPALGPTQPHVK